MRSDDEPQEVNDPQEPYKKAEIVFFSSFAEEEEYNLKYAASLSPLECMQQMRKLIHLAYGMHGVNFDNPPKIHTIFFE